MHNLKLWMMNRLALVIALPLAACTSLGQPDEAALSATDFGPEETLRICVLVDTPDISTDRAKALMVPVTQEFAQYGIRVTVPQYVSWHRPSGAGHEIIEALAAQQLAAPCDRLLALTGRDFGAVLIGLLGVEELGAVDTVTHTRGYVVSETASVNQVFSPPEAAVVHECYHLLGCDHDTSMAECYERIRVLKVAAHSNAIAGVDFFPTYNRRDQVIFYRQDVDLREAAALRVHRAKEHGVN